MLARMRARLSYANVMSTMAVFLALGGTSAYAINEWTGANIVDESLTGADVKGKPGTSTTAAVNGSLTTNEIAGQQANAANGTPFVDGTLTQWDIKDNSATGSDVVESSLGKVPSAANADKLGGVAAKPVVKLVGAGSTDHDRCAEVPPATGVFCSTGPVGSTTDFVPWANYGDIWAPAAYYKDAFGIVHLEGLIREGYRNYNEAPNTPKTIFILPAGYRPAASHIFIVTGRENFEDREMNGRIDVHSDGQVILSIRPDSEPNFISALAHLSLDGISFRAA